MPLQKGRQQYLAVKQESTRLTPATTGFIPLHWNTLRGEGSKNTYRNDEQAAGRRAKQIQKSLIEQHAEFGYDALLDADQIIYPLAAIFGGGLTPTTALGASTYNLTVSQLLETPTFTVQYNTGDTGQKRIVGWLPSKFELNVSTEDVTISVDGMGVREDAGTAITPTYTAMNKFLLPQHFTLGYATSQAGLSSATTIGELKSLKFTIESGQDIMRHNVLGALNPNNNTVDGITASVEFDVLLNGAQATTLEGFHNTNAQNALRIDGHDTTAPVLGTSLLRPRVQFNLPPSTWEMTRKIEKDELLMQSFKIDVNNADLITALVQNAIATVA